MNASKIYAAQGFSSDSNQPDMALMTEQKNLEATEWFKKGVIAQDQKQFEQAINAYTRVLHLIPDHFEAIYNLAVLYHEQGKLDLAQQTYIETLKQNPEYSSMTLTKLLVNANIKTWKKDVVFWYWNRKDRNESVHFHNTKYEENIF